MSRHFANKLREPIIVEFGRGIAQQKTRPHRRAFRKQFQLSHQQRSRQQLLLSSRYSVFDPRPVQPNTELGAVWSDLSHAAGLIVVSALLERLGEALVPRPPRAIAQLQIHS